MDNYTISGQTDAIVDAIMDGYDTNYHHFDIKDLKGTIKSALDQYWSDKMASIWHVEDVQQQAGYEMSTELAKKVLDFIDKYHDADIGINWHVIDFALEDFQQEIAEDKRRINGG